MVWIKLSPLDEPDKPLKGMLLLIWLYLTVSDSTEPIKIKVNVIIIKLRVFNFFSFTNYQVNP